MNKPTASSPSHDHVSLAGFNKCLALDNHAEGNEPGDATAHLLGPEGMFVVRAQACFYMVHLHTLGVVGRETGSQHGGVTMCQDDVGVPLLVHIHHACSAAHCW